MGMYPLHKTLSGLLLTREMFVVCFLATNLRKLSPWKNSGQSFPLFMWELSQPHHLFCEAFTDCQSVHEALDRWTE